MKEGKTDMNFDPEEVTDLQVELMNACDGLPCAVIYVAVANLLGVMESLDVKPDRAGLFKLMGECMDDYMRIHASRDCAIASPPSEASTP
jgi:hypothetical protein